MTKEIIDYAYASLLHDIGKFYQRTSRVSLLNTQEAACSPISKYGYHTHVHSGYTAKFFHDYLHLNDELEKGASAHHLNDERQFDKVIRQADRIASKIDRNDEEYDDEENHKRTKYQYITSRLSSIMGQVDFGKELNDSKFKLNSINQSLNPICDYKEKDLVQSVDEYKNLFDQFVDEVNKDNLLIGQPTSYKFHRMYALLYKYTTLIPSSTYETNKQTVSLFDHLKLTSAIASCLSQSDGENFYMVEFDVSGIQKFIYKITEGEKTKTKVAKSLRGRSILVSLITNSVTYAILDEFKLTQANIIFNTGGGAVILLPYLQDAKERISKLFKQITHELYKRFHTSLTLVYAIEKLDKEELHDFKSNKALSLKTTLEDKKLRKYDQIIDDQFCVETLADKELCQLCGDDYSVSQGNCQNCQDIIEVSDYYTTHDHFTILYSKEEYGQYALDLGFIKIYLYDKLPNEFINKNKFYYIDAVNHYEAGNIKLVANLVPQNDNEILTFEKIAQSLDTSYGDQKLGVLKMDVDNLGAIFAFGLKTKKDQDIALQRSLSKYITLSRFMELFFGYKLKQICLDLSNELGVNHDIFYINYAGGDDLVIIGPIYGIIKLASRIHNEFKSFVNNPNITLSGGIHIQNPKKPIRFGVQMADQALEKSKGLKENDELIKNAITIMDSTIPFNQFDDLLADVEVYRAYINDKNNPLSRTCFYNIMSQMSDKTLEEYYSIVPIIQYVLYRQIDKNHEKLRKKILKDLTTIRNQNNLSRWITIMKLVILFTREGN